GRGPAGGRGEARGHDGRARGIGVLRVARGLRHEGARQARAQGGVGHQLGECLAIARDQRGEEARGRALQVAMPAVEDLAAHEGERAARIGAIAILLLRLYVAAWLPAGITKRAAQHDAVHGDFQVRDPHASGEARAARPLGRARPVPHAPEPEAELPALRPRLAGPGEEELDAGASRARPSIDLGHTAVGPGLEERDLAVAPAVETDGVPYPFGRETKTAEEQAVAECLYAQRGAAPRIAEGIQPLPDELGGGIRAARAEAVEALAVEDAVDPPLHRRVEGRSRVFYDGETGLGELAEALEPVGGGRSPGRARPGEDEQRPQPYQK